MPRIINQIAIHHAGGVGSDNFASTRHLTVAHINRAHKERWEFESKYFKRHFEGYNSIYDPKSRIFTQCRAIGEDTASIRGHNFNTFHLCILGNYNKKPIGSPAGLVDPMTEQIRGDVAKYIFDLINNNSRNLVVADNVELTFSKTRIYSHRFFSRTMCYGTGLRENLFRDDVLKIKTIQNDKIQEKIILLQTLLRLYVDILNLLRKRQAQKIYLGSVEDREDPENLPARVVDYKF